MNDLQTLFGEDVFPNLDNIGDSQYRAIYETLDGAMEDCEPADREDLIRTILGEFKEWSEALLRRLGTRVCLDRYERNAVLANKADGAAEPNPEELGGTDHRVRIEIDVSARDAMEAAQEAYRLLRSHDCTPWVCEVFAGADTSQTPLVVDLSHAAS